MMSVPKNLVFFKYCHSYDQQHVDKAISELLSAIGEDKPVIKEGAKVLIKPNLLTDELPENAATTHPAVVRALVRYVKQHNAIPIVGDSPAGALNIKKVWERTGIKAVCEEEGAELVSFEQYGAASFTYEKTQFSISKYALEADLIINAPKLKTHTLITLTNAVKNLYGTMPGYQKTVHHKELFTPEQISGLIAELYAIIRPQLNVCDAIHAMEGAGPSGGEITSLNFLAASTDAALLDTAISHILRIPFESIPYLVAIRERKLTETDASRITMAGDALEKIKDRKFKLPRTAIVRKIPQCLIKLLKPFLWLRPAFSNKKCILCKRCIEACPMKALSIWKNKKTPLLQRALCIGCCCCHEVCSVKAIHMRLSPLLWIIRMGKLPQ
jgi:uncharacterized protein (DUF362 family)/Pyruvate/2-oxoacid:ferredoxin oxidoreductase delta subunit